MMDDITPLRVFNASFACDNKNPWTLYEIFLKNDRKNVMSDIFIFLRVLLLNFVAITT